MRIAVYSGSFNPLHIGHLAILRYLSQCGGFGKVYLVVSPQNPFKGAENLESAKRRLEDAKAAVALHPELGNVQVSDIEFSMPAPQYSYRTLCALRDAHPGDEFSIVIGADNLAAFRRWKNYREILLEFGVCVYPREGVDEAAVMNDLMSENPLYRLSIIDLPEVNVSSTQIRNAVANGQDVSDLLM